jgi:hypothetical protein
MLLKNGAQRGVKETRYFIEYVTDERGTEECDGSQKLHD